MEILNRIFEYLIGDGWFITGIAILIFLDFLGRVFIKKEFDKIDFKEGFSSGVIGVLYITVGVGMAGLVSDPMSHFAHEHRLWTVPEVWWAPFLAFLLGDLTYYWGHRWLHTVRLFGCIHLVHHSAKDLSVATAIKMPVWEPLFFALAFSWFLSFLGFEGITPALGAGFGFLFGAFHHTTVIPKLGRLDKYIPFVTPAQHRVHHGSDLKYLDRNYGGVLIIWDWIFGTFQDEEEEPTYGLTKNIDSYDPLYLHTVGFKELWQDVKGANSWSDRLKYIFYPPGWSPDGSSLTTKQMRALDQKSDSPQNTLRHRKEIDDLQVP